MIISNATLNGLRTTFSLVFGEAYKNTEVWWPKMATEVPSSSKSNTYGWLAKSVKLREWAGARVALNLKERGQVLENKPFEATVEVDLDDIEDDELGMYTSMLMPQIGEAVKKHPDELIADMLAANPLCFDGKALFAADHPTYAPTGSTQTYNNTHSLALTAANFNTVWSTMVSIVGEDGKTLKINPQTLFVPPQLKKTALEIMQSTTAAAPIKNVGNTENVGGATIDNVMKGWAEVVVLEELAGEPTRWYVADCSKVIKPVIYQVRRKPQFVSRTDPSDSKVFEQKVFTFGVDYRANVGPTLPFLIARSKP